jgi:hypothetical protein
MLLRQVLINYLQNIRSLPVIQYKNENICYRDINVFNVCSKNMNDANNKKRENIIGSIIDNTRIRMDVDNHFTKYFKFSRRWNNIKDAIFNYIQHELNININKDINLIHRGGRKYNYDFEIKSESVKYNIELKFNAKSVSNAPQFVSPYNPSKYMRSSYEEFYYDNYLPKLKSLRDDLVIPDKRIYLQEINSPAPNCMKLYKDIYDNGCKKSSKYTGDPKDIEFYKLANKLSKESIVAFMSTTVLNIDLLNEYLISSQNDKIYMLYKNGKFYKQIVDPSKYTIVSYTVCKNKKNKFVAKTQEGKNIKILLRWKNGNGVAFPAFQIS